MSEEHKNHLETGASFRSFLEIRAALIITPLEDFIHKQTTAAALLLLATLVSLFVANSVWSTHAAEIINFQAGFSIHEWHFSMPLHEWVGSGLMALFFFLIGLEVKREVLAGRLHDVRQVRLLILAAIGGMVLPALLYWALNHGTAGQHGWAIPMATDTAFAIGVLAIMARRVSYGASIFLAAMAIFDDIGAMLVISLFYSHEIQITPIIGSIAIMLVLFAINRVGIRNGWTYALLGVGLWAFIYNSGLHATLAGMLMA